MGIIKDTKLKRISARLERDIKVAVIESLEEIIDAGEKDDIIHTYEGKNYTVEEMLYEVRKNTLAGKDFYKLGIKGWVKFALEKNGGTI